MDIEKHLLYFFLGLLLLAAFVIVTVIMAHAIYWIMAYVIQAYGLTATIFALVVGSFISYTVGRLFANNSF